MAIKTSPVNVEERKSFDIKPGDTVRVYQKVVEKGKTRMQPFEGMVIARKHGVEPGATFTVRRVSSGVGVERIFPLYSPNIDKIEVLRRARVRRAKLYYVREKVAREIRRQMRRMQFVDESTESETDRAARAEAEAQQAQEQEEQQTEETSEEEGNAGDDTSSSEEEENTSEEQTQDSEENNSQEEVADDTSESADEAKEK